MSKVDLMKRFVTSEPIEVSHVTVDSIPQVPERDELIAYHQVLGYEVEIKIDPTGDHLTIVPCDTRTQKWNENTKKFLELLKYIPVPDHMEVPGRNLSMLLKKDVVASKPELSRSGWHLAWSRMCKTSMRRPGENKVELVEVLFVWERDDYDGYVGSCWKY